MANSGTQLSLFQGVCRQLDELGFSDRLLIRNYGFQDYFDPDRPERVAPAAAFANLPASYDSACHCVLLAGDCSGIDLVRQFRSLGAPFAFEVQDDQVVPWAVGRDDDHTARFPPIAGDRVEQVFAAQAKEWSRQTVMRAKNISLQPEERQLEFSFLGIDFGLIIELEHLVCTHLDKLLRDAIAEATQLYISEAGSEPDYRQLFRLVFRTLAGKILHDREITGFKRLDPDEPDQILEKVADYYGEQGMAVLRRKSVRLAIAKRLWKGVDFRNLSVHILAYIYETTLVDPEVRQAYGTHSTPHTIAQYIVQRLPFEDVAPDRRIVVEPCSGHSIFLVAAMRRLRDLLPGQMDERERHRIFVRLLHGFEIDPFALEVSRLCLMLADFPNPNHWRLTQADVFRSSEFLETVREAGIVLCNPPFEAFREDERRPAHRAVQKPVELLHRVLDVMADDALLGFVLPRVVIDGVGYRNVRRRLANRYARLEIVSLPDRIFRHSLLESALVLGMEPRSGRYETEVSFSYVSDDDRQSFLDSYRVTYHEQDDVPNHRLERSFALPPLRDVWEHLHSYPPLDEIAEVHRGVEWQAPFDEDKYLSRTPKPEFVPGMHSARDNLLPYVKPTTDFPFLNARQEDRRGGAWDLPWGDHKVVVNAVRADRGVWRVAAFTDTEGLVYSQNFHGVWPRGRYSPRLVVALLNSPVANAFIWSQELQGKHIKVKTLKRLPIPRLSGDAIGEIEAAVATYEGALDEGTTGVFRHGAGPGMLKGALLGWTPQSCAHMPFRLTSKARFSGG
jgi:hypothetical protein